MGRVLDLEIFVEVVREGSFTTAAENLAVSKSFVSKQISALEDHLGVRLLNRTTRKIAVTDAGAAFFERARQILDDIDEAERAVMQLNTSPRGTLRISAPMIFGLRYIAPLAAKFTADHPELTVDLDFNDRQVDVLDEGFDLVIRVGQLADSSFVAKKLAPIRTLLVASPGYLSTHGTPAHPQDLANHECLQYTYQSSPTMWRFDRPNQATVHVPVSGRFRANNGDAILDACRQGLGIAGLPDFITREALATGELVEILPEWSSNNRAVWALYPHNRHLSAKVRLFIDYVQASLQPVPWSIADT